MSNWLLKTEPGEFSFSDLLREKKATWNGVTNNLALKHLRSFKKGDVVFFYHTGNEKSIVGLAEVVSNPYPDPNLNDGKLVVIDIKPKRTFRRKVSLSEIKSKKEFTSFDLVKNSRLSVIPVSDIIAALLLQLSEQE
ncbi:MAG: EVE domain-containing protein [Ignavibacteriae bacterium]|nr:EVE domain-containing protein [Ignavibacteriota bacterium]